MRDRKGVICVAFDLPTTTSADRADYRRFRSYLIKNGFVMFQESLYFKIIRNTLNSSKEIREVSANAPKRGNIIALTLTANELSKVKTIKGSGINMEELTEDVFFY